MLNNEAVGKPGSDEHRCSARMITFTELIDNRKEARDMKQKQVKTAVRARGETITRDRTCPFYRGATGRSQIAKE